MTRYDWSKLDEGWTFDESTWLLRHGSNWITLRELLPIINQVNPSLFDEFKCEAMRQISKCRVRDTERAPSTDECDHEWNEVKTVCVKCRKTLADMQREQELAPVDNTRTRLDELLDSVGAVETAVRHGYPPGLACKALLGELPIDNTPLFEAMDRMAAEVPKEEWERVPTYQMGVDYDHRELELGDGFCESWVTPPPPPWSRGPLAAWTLVNISCHDGRLTVVMKRGRGELVIETGPDDEFLWVRLEQKVVDLDKAKAKKAKGDE